MKKTILSLLTFAFIASACNENSKLSEEVDLNLPKPTETKEMLSYTVGFDQASRVGSDTLLNIDHKYAILGFIHGLNKKNKGFFTPEEHQKNIQTYFDAMNANLMQEHNNKVNEMGSKGEKFKVEVPKFIDEYKAKAGVKTTTTGLMYKILKDASGKKALSDDLITFDMKVSLIDGTVVSDTYDAQTPAMKGPIIQIPGFKEALLSIPVGSEWEVVIPPSLAFGAEGNPPQIPPHSALVCKITLISIDGKFDPKNMPNMPPGATGPGQMPPRQQ